MTHLKRLLYAYLLIGYSYAAYQGVLVVISRSAPVCGMEMVNICYGRVSR